MQVSQSIPFCGEGNQDAAKGVVHCRGRPDVRPSSSPHLLTYSGLPPSLYLPFWARAQKLRCRWA